MPTTCKTCFIPQTGYPVERKVIDSSGRLGSLYDAHRDRLIDRHSVGSFRRKLPNKHVVCRLFSGEESRELLQVLGIIGFDDSVRQSIRHRMVTPAGTSQAIEYDQPVHQNTRFLYYSYQTRVDKLDVQARQAHRVVGPPSGPTEATHMITKILWGIELLCIIQVPKNQSVDQVDELLHRIHHSLKYNQFPIVITNNDRRLLNQLTNTTIFGSETCVDDPHTSLLTVLSRIQDWQSNFDLHQPLKYTMQPLRWLYNNIQYRQPCQTPPPKTPQLDRAELVLKRVDKQIKDLGHLFQNLPTKFTSVTLQQKLKDYQQQYRFILDTQENLQTRLQKVIPNIRRSHLSSGEIDSILSDQRYKCLEQVELEQVHANVDRLSSKAIFIHTLNKTQVEYINASDVHTAGTVSTAPDDVDNSLRRSFSNENHPVILCYSSDRLKREQANRWDQLYQQLLSERQQTSSATQLFYVDFTHCQYHLIDFDIVRIQPRGQPLPESKPRRSITPPSPTHFQPILPPLPPARVHLKTEINVLLLGETGVGKSTFINAFVNYLKFDTLQQAEQGEPVVLIPVSFLVTVGDQFDEVIVKFGNVDANEDFDHQGQSVTQQCKSYAFDLNDRVCLRLIDTPGIGDTRGLAQDIKNIDHILTYINNLPHLNAVCLLLKPNESRLNVFFRSCVNQLLTYLTPAGYNNIIFCFTNSRATFYAPGETGPLLRKMLRDEHLDRIPFKKDNTFCFDSESFRYLAARKCHVSFDDYQKQECISSWDASVTQSGRLLNFIQSRPTYYLETRLSPRKVVLDISTLARPLMETMRLIIYNWKFSEAKLIGKRMELTASTVDEEFCTNCAQIVLSKLGPFWVTEYRPVLPKTKTNPHRLCSLDESHFLIETIVEHQSIDEPAGITVEQWQSSFHNFLLKCDRLLHFSRQQGPSHNEDPFRSILERYLAEEQQISQNRNINSDMNRRVHDTLQSIKQIRQRNSEQLFTANERLSIDEIHQIVGELLKVKTVEKQLNSIKQSRQIKMKASEQSISANLIRNQIFAS